MIVTVNGRMSETNQWLIRQDGLRKTKDNALKIEIEEATVQRA